MRYSEFDWRQQVRDEYRELDAFTVCVCDSMRKTMKAKDFGLEILVLVVPLPGPVRSPHTGGFLNS